GGGSIVVHTNGPGGIPPPAGPGPEGILPPNRVQPLVMEVQFDSSAARYSGFVNPLPAGVASEPRTNPRPAHRGAARSILLSTQTPWEGKILWTSFPDSEFALEL